MQVTYMIRILHLQVLPVVDQGNRALKGHKIVCKQCVPLQCFVFSNLGPPLGITEVYTQQKLIFIRQSTLSTTLSSSNEGHYVRVYCVHLLKAVTKVNHNYNRKITTQQNCLHFLGVCEGFDQSESSASEVLLYQ